jgi:hypothetical protein
MKSLLKLWALLVPLVLMGSFGGGSFGSGSSISANGKGMQGSQGSGASAPAPAFSLYDIASGPSQLAGVATYNGTELTTVLECFGEGFTEGVGLVCATGGTWTESSDGVDDDDWPGAWSDHTNEAFEMVGSGADALLTPSPTLFDAVSGKDVFVEAVYWPDVSQNQALIDWRDRADNGQGIAIWLDSSEVVRSIADCDGTDTGAASPVGRAGTSIDAWNFASFVFDHNATAGRSISLGVNGGASSYAGDPCTGDMLNVSGVASQARIGDLTQSASTYEFEGKISYIAVRYCDGCVVDEPGGTTSEAYNAERFARLTGTYAADGTDKIPSLATRASAGMACHLNDSGVRKCDQVGDNWIRTYDVADTGWDDASATHTTGILIEEERTSLIVAESDWSATNGWTSTANLNGTLTSYNGSPISGLGGAYTADAGAATDYHQLQEGLTVAAGTTYAQSCVVKPGAADFFVLGYDDGTTDLTYFDLTDCSVTATQPNDDAGAVDWGDGWCQVWINKTSAVTGVRNSFYGWAEAEGDRQFAGDGSTVTGYVANCQFEAGSFPSSPIYTTNAGAVTRSADALQYLPFASDVGSSGTFTHVDTAITPPVVQSSYQAVSSIDDASSPGVRSRHYWRSTRFDLDADGGGGILFDSANWGASEGHGFFTTTKGTFEPGVIATAYVNGSASGSPDQAGDTPANIDRVSIGALHTGANPFQGVITCSATYDGVALTEDDGVCQ